MNVSLSAVDSDRFGVRIARAVIITSPDLSAALDFCRAQAVQMLITRCPVAAIGTVQAMEGAGFRLMDTLLYFQRDLARDPLPTDAANAVTLRAANADDADTLASIARRAFAGYLSHYHADMRLDRAACDAAYTDWARNSVLKSGVADRVLLAEDAAGIPLGFLTLRRLNSAETDGPLFAVTPEAQGQGVGRALMLAGLRWSQEQGAARMIMSTQVTNTQSPRVWMRLGFVPHSAEYTFHKWFE